jgi:hypothetical protein
MKIKVADSVKGKLNIIGLTGTLLAGQEADLTKEQFSSYQVQSLLKSGVLQSSSYKPSANLQYKNNTGNKVRMPWGQIIGPNQAFDVELENSSSVRFLNLIKEGFISQFDKPKTEEGKPKIVKEKKSKTVDKLPKNTKDVVDSQKPPKDTYIHDPNVKTKAYVENRISEIEKDLEEGNFVDKKQTRDRLLKMQNSLRNQQKE